MYISNCPRCHDSFRVPDGELPVDAQAQCPWCSETFPMVEVIGQLPPVLNILSDHAVTDDLGAHAHAADASTEIDVESFELSDGESALNETVAFVGDDTYSEFAAADDRPSAEVMTSSPTIQPRRRNKSGGGLRSAVGVIGGGLLALPIAVGILWGLGLGPFADSGGPGGTRVASNPVQQPTNVDVPQDLETVAAEQPTAEVAEAQADSIVVQPIAPEQQEPALTLPEDVDVATSGDVAELSDSGESNAGEPTIEMRRPEVEVVDLNQPTESEELVSTVKKALKMVQAIDRLEADDSRRNRYLTTAYRTIAQASELATKKGPSIQELAQAIKRSKAVADFEVAGSKWLAVPARNNNGVLIIGESDGRTLTLQSGAQVSVTGASLPSSGRAMALGTILENDSVEAVLVDSL